MALRLEVTYCGAPGCCVGVVGSDPALGAWDTSKVVRLSPDQDDPSKWLADLPLPSPESEFKLVTAQADGQVQWEELPENSNRRFPARCVSAGCTLRMQFGEPRMAIEASAEEIEANARATRRMEDRQGSALQANVDRKGDNAYYFAHNRHFEVPADAKVISGPGLITGGAPVLIEAGAVMGSEQDRTVWLKDYSWSDSSGKVKVYVPVPEGLLPADGAQDVVQCEYTSTQVELTINCKPRQRLKIEKLNGELVVDKCTTRVEAHKNRIVLQLAKKRETTWYNLTKK
uniref:CBM20 domain-containing protein n=1 Tax=Zooxanthella nutricula TaxID=1333877 RepID=A0A7S2JD57_9DINO